MLELVILAVFCAELIVCVAAGLPISGALVVGLVLFLGYGHYKGHGPSELAKMCADGISTAKGVLEAFVLIGILTALWRASGTISEVVVVATPLVRPALAPLAIFALCCLMSFLTGTSFGTAATMGVVCMTMASSMGANALACGGAVLAGAYFGDRCSPMSSSALLVRSITCTDMAGNFRAMMRSAAVPLALTIVIYGVAGLVFCPAGGAGDNETVSMLASFFNQGPVALLPTVPVLVLPLFRVGMKRSMAVSVVIAALVCVFARGMAPAELLRTAVFGYAPQDAQVAALMSGGGLASMVNVAFIVCLSSSFAGIFSATGMLDGVQRHIAALAERVTTFGAILAVVIPASMVACNQTLGTMLAYQLCSDLEPDRRAMALDLEDSVIVLSPLVPWSIACSAVISMCGAPAACWLTAVYLWLIPLWHLIRSLRERRHATAAATPAVEAAKPVHATPAAR